MDQDEEVGGGPLVPGWLILAALRVVAGEEGRSRVSWSGQGFTYVLRAYRLDGDDPLLLPDIDAGHGPNVSEAIELLREYLTE